MTDMNSGARGRHFKGVEGDAFARQQGSATPSQGVRPTGGPRPAAAPSETTEFMKAASASRNAQTQNAQGFNRSGATAGSMPAAAKPGRPAVSGAAYKASGAPNSNPYGMSPQGDAPNKRKKGLVIALSVILVLVVALAGVGGMALFSAKSLKGKATETLGKVTTLTDSISNHDFATASQAATDIANLSADVRNELNSPLWTAASLIPVYGGDITNARALIGSLNEVAADALVPIMEALDANPLGELISSDKVIDTKGLGQIFSAVEGSVDTLQKNIKVINDLPAFHISQLEEKVAPVKEKLAGVDGMLETVATVMPIADDIFGVNGDRVYLLAAQNSAEMRAGGGFPGSMGTISIKDGKIKLGDFASVYDMMVTKRPKSIKVSDTEVELFGEQDMKVARKASIIPDFTRVAEIWAAAYKAKSDKKVDGVVSITPAVVQDILSITGPITLTDGTTLDGTNATKVLQHDLYWKYLSKDPDALGGNDAADALFSETAGLAFENLFASLDGKTLVEMLGVMKSRVADRSVMLWLSDAEEQEALSEIACSGDIVTDPLKPAVGTYFSVTRGSKMGWYIDIENEILSMKKNTDGSKTYSVKTTYRNTATQEVIDTGGNYIIGLRRKGENRSNLIPLIQIYAPTGGSIGSFKATNGAKFEEKEYKGLQLFNARPDFLAGDTIVCTYEVTTAPNAEELTFMSTPTLTSYR